MAVGKVPFALIMSAGSGLSKIIQVQRALSRGTVHFKMVNFLSSIADTTLEVTDSGIRSRCWGLRWDLRRIPNKGRWHGGCWARRCSGAERLVRASGEAWL